MIKLNPMRVAAQAVGGIGDLAAVELIIGVGLSNHTGFVIDQLDLGRSALFDALTASGKAEIAGFNSVVLFAASINRTTFTRISFSFIHSINACWPAAGIFWNDVIHKKPNTSSHRRPISAPPSQPHREALTQMRFH